MPKKLIKQTSIYENDLCLININPDAQISDIGEQNSLTVELKEGLVSDRS